MQYFSARAKNAFSSESKVCSVILTDILFLSENMISTIVTVSYSKNHSNFDYCCSFYVRKEGVNFLFDAICKCGYIAFENVLIDETDMRLLCDTAEDALEIL